MVSLTSIILPPAVACSSTNRPLQAFFTSRCEGNSALSTRRDQFFADRRERPDEVTCCPGRRNLRGGRARTKQRSRNGRHANCSRPCESRDSNPDGFPHWILSPARLPIPPLPHVVPRIGVVNMCAPSHAVISETPWPEPHRTPRRPLEPHNFPPGTHSHSRSVHHMTPGFSFLSPEDLVITVEDRVLPNQDRRATVSFFPTPQLAAAA